MNTGSLSCCGIKEIIGIRYAYSPIQGARDLINQIALSIGYRGAVVIFSDTTDGQRAKNIAEVLKKMNLGKVQGFEKVLNRNSNNNLDIYMFEYDVEACQRFLNKTIQEIESEMIQIELTPLAEKIGPTGAKIIIKTTKILKTDIRDVCRMVLPRKFAKLL